MGKSSFDLTTDDCGIHGSRADLRQGHCFRFLFAYKMRVSPKAESLSSCGFFSLRPAMAEARFIADLPISRSDVPSGTT